MIIDCREWYKLPDNGESERRLIFLDGKEISGVWYVDTDKGELRTYHVLLDAPDEVVLQFDKHGNRRRTFSSYRFPRELLPDDWDIETPFNGAAYRTLHGQVEVFSLLNQCA